MITEDQVVEAYRKALQMNARRVRLDGTVRGETEVEQDERLDAVAEHATLELQYLAEQA